MANFKEHRGYVARLGKYGHDLSRRVLFTSAPGQLLPVLCDFLSPGDSIRINSKLFTRTQPLRTAAFVRATEHIYYFFVPMNLIDPYFEQQFFGINDLGNSNDAVPTSQTSSGNSLPQPYMLPNQRLFLVPQYLKAALFGSSNPTLPSQPMNGAYTVVANPNDDSSKVIQLAPPDFDDNPRSAALYDPYGVPRIFNAQRLLDMLGYGSQLLDASSNDLSTARNLYLNPDPLFVYQRIFYDYFRRSMWHPCNVYAFNKGYYYKNGGISSLWTFDLSHFSDLYYYGFLALHYHPLKRDFFTGNVSTPLFDITGVSGYNYDQTDISSSLTGPSSAILSAYGVQLQDPIGNITTPSNSGVVSSVPLASGHNASFSIPGLNTYIGRAINNGESDVAYSGSHISVQQLRLAYAYDRMMSITQRAGRHYEDQVKAHFGFSVPRGVSDETYYLGSHDTDLMIGEVMATAAGSTGSEGGASSVLGEIAGRGLASSGKQKRINFTAPCHGYLMAIYSCVPDIDYHDYGTERLNTYVSINSFPHPEFDQIGMQPLLAFQAQWNLGTLSDSLSYDTFIGWQPRNQELKCSYDVVHGAFNNSLSDWVAAQFFMSNIAYSNLYFNMWDAFYVNPNILDNLFAVSFLPAATEPTIVSDYNGAQEVGQVPTMNHLTNVAKYAYMRDPLLNSLDIKYYKTSFMKPNTDPSL